MAPAGVVGGGAVHQQQIRSRTAAPPRDPCPVPGDGRLPDRLGRSDGHRTLLSIPCSSLRTRESLVRAAASRLGEHPMRRHPAIRRRRPVPTPPPLRDGDVVGAQLPGRRASSTIRTSRTSFPLVQDRPWLRPWLGVIAPFAEQVVLHREQVGRACGHADLGVDVLDVVAHGLRRDPKSPPTSRLEALSAISRRTSTSRSESPAGRVARRRPAEVPSAQRSASTAVRSSLPPVTSRQSTSAAAGASAGRCGLSSRSAVQDVGAPQAPPSRAAVHRCLGDSRIRRAVRGEHRRAHDRSQSRASAEDSFGEAQPHAFAVVDAGVTGRSQIPLGTPTAPTSATAARLRMAISASGSPHARPAARVVAASRDAARVHIERQVEKSPTAARARSSPTAPTRRTGSGLRPRPRPPTGRDRLGPGSRPRGPRSTTAGRRPGRACGPARPSPRQCRPSAL